MEKAKVILDVDTGSDDAIAIMTAVKSEDLDVLAITTVNGQQTCTKYNGKHVTCSRPPGI